MNRARCRFQFGRRDELDSLCRAAWVAYIPTGRPVEGMTVWQAARVGEEMPDLHRGRVVRKLRDETADIVVKMQIAVENQQTDARSGELLGDRGHVEDGCGVQSSTPWFDSPKGPPLLDQTVPDDGNNRARLSWIEADISRPIQLIIYRRHGRLPHGLAAEVTQRTFESKEANSPTDEWRLFARPRLLRSPR